MKTLELKYLTPYIPFGVHLMNNYGNWHNTTLNKSLSIYQMLEMKMLLRPLSNFIYDDILKAKEFIGFNNWCDAYDEYFDIWFDDLANTDKLVLQAPYPIFNYFLSEKFDVFSLIKDNLAIDINTINQ